jgi:hypothetical protein
MLSCFPHRVGLPILVLCCSFYVCVQSTWSNAQPANQSGSRARITQNQTTPPAGHDAAELAQKLSNPILSLISVPFQSNFDTGMGTGSGCRYTLNFQPVITSAPTGRCSVVSRIVRGSWALKNVLEN